MKSYPMRFEVHIGDPDHGETIVQVRGDVSMVAPDEQVARHGITEMFDQFCQRGADAVPGGKVVMLAACGDDPLEHAAEWLAGHSGGDVFQSWLDGALASTVAKDLEGCFGDGSPEVDTQSSE